jgi:putative inorganic carbon (HCO3(-)) transporter
MSRHLAFWREQGLSKTNQAVRFVIAAILVGAVSGVLAVIAGSVSTRWTMVIILGVLAPVVVMVINDIKKLVLIVLILDFALGIDIAIQNQGTHQGGPTGYIVSLGTIALVIGYASWIARREPKPRAFPVVTIPALLYLFAVVLSMFRSADPQLSAFGLFLHVQAFLIYFYVANNVRTRSTLRLVINAAMICLILESGLMVLQYFSGVSLNVGDLVMSESFAEGTGGAGVVGARVSGTLGRPHTAALYLNSMLLLILGGYLTGIVNRKLALGAFFIGILALLVTASRGGWLSFAAGMLVMMGLVVWTKRGRKGLPAVLMVGFLIAVLFGGQLLQRFATIEEDKTRSRLETMAHNIIDAYPQGVGENTYELYMTDEYAHPEMVGHTHLPVHNRYLLVWAETGIQGLIAFLLLLASPIWQSRRWLFQIRSAPPLAILGVSLIGAYSAHIVHMMGENFNGRPQIQMLWFIIAMIVAVGQLITQEQTDSASPPDVIGPEGRGA